MGKALLEMGAPVGSRTIGVQKIGRGDLEPSAFERFIRAKTDLDLQANPIYQGLVLSYNMKTHFERGEYRAAGADASDLAELGVTAVIGGHSFLKGGFVRGGAALESEGAASVGAARRGGAIKGSNPISTISTEKSVSYRIGAPVTKIDSYTWATMPYEERIAAIVSKYGINLRGRTVVFDPKLGTGQLGMTSSANPSVLRVGSGVMNSEQELAATIAHELRHSRAYMGSGSNAEAAAEASENALRQYIQGGR